APFEPSQPPVIEGFNPSVYSTSESFKEKFLRKTRENPMVPIGKQAGAKGTVDQEDSDIEGNEIGEDRGRQAAWAQRPPLPTASTASTG
ncbi:hypothetical protein E2I00_006815, partial [Balaenoptera physalus]